MYTKGEIIQLWMKVLGKFKEDFPAYDLLLRKHGWSAGVRERKNSSFGWADNRDRKVIINWHLHKNSTESMIVDTMLHEIAHAVDFCNRGRSDHSAHWKAIAEEIGAIPKSVSKAAISVEYKYVMALHIPGEEIRFVKGYNKRPSRQRANAICYGTYLTKRKDETIDKIWLLTWDEWCKLCVRYGKGPFREDHK